jgi:hypothetical protein
MPCTDGCREFPLCEDCAAEISPEDACSVEESTGPYVCFDDACLVQNQVTDSDIFPAENCNTARITGVYIARTAVATITFTVLVSDDGSTWTSAGGFNVTSLGSFSASVGSLNAKLVRCRTTITAPATVVFAATVTLVRM